MMISLATPGLTLDLLNARAAALRASAALADLIASTQPNQVMRVYSGRDGKCCCGCSGIYRASSAHRLAADASRGYPHDDDEINDRFVAKVLATFKNVAGQAPELLARVHDNCIAVVVGDRLYMLFLAPVGAA